MERWFELAMTRKEVERALVTDRIRRHRFYETHRWVARLACVSFRRRRI